MAKRPKKAWGDGSVFEYPEGSGVWWAQLKKGPDGKRPKRRAASEADAYTLLAEMINERKQGLKLGVKSPTVAELIDIWLEGVMRRTVKATTYHNYTQYAKLYVTPHIGPIRVKDLTQPQVQAMVNLLTDAHAAGTARAGYQVLHAALEYAIVAKYRSDNPADKVKLPHLEKGEPRALIIVEARRLLAAGDTHRLGALYWVLLSLGLRKGEVLGLLWNDLNWEKAELKITQQIQTIDGKTTATTPKTKTSKRTVPVPPLLLERLRTHWNTQQEERRLLGAEWHEHGLIFPSEVGTPMGPRNLNRMYYDVRNTAELPGVRLHDLRHTCGTCLGDLGVPEMVIAALLGHSGGSITWRYVHPTIKAMRAAVERLEHLLTGNDLEQQSEDE
jgi:integrase